MTPLQNTLSVDVSVLETLLHDLANRRTDIAIRLELNGTSRPEHFSGVLVAAGHAIVLTHMPTRTVTTLRDLREVTGFEIDRAYKDLQPFQYYRINPRCVSLKKEKNGLLHA